MPLQGVHGDGYIQRCTSLASTLFSIEFEEFEGRVRLQGIVDWQVSLRRCSAVTVEERSRAHS